MTALEDALDVVLGLRREDGRTIGESAVEWQMADFRAVLDPQALPYNAITRPRGGSKTEDLAAIGVGVLLTQAPPASRCYCLAADRDQGALFIDSVRGFVGRSPELRGALKVDAYRVTATRREAALEVLAADAPSAWGLRPFLLIVDELANWGTTSGPKALYEATTTALPKVPGSRCVVLTSAGDPAHWSRKVFDRAVESPLWRVVEIPGPVPWVDAERLEEERRRLPESSFRRLHLNEWTASEDRLVSEDDLAACVILDGPVAPELGRSYVIGLDIGIRHDATVATVCHLDADARIVLDRIEVWAPKRGQTVELGVVEEWLDVTARVYNRARVVFDPYQAIQLTQRLRARGITTEEFTFSSASVGRLAVNLHQLLRERRLSLPDDEALLDELRNVRLRETAPGVLRLDHDADKHDDRAVSLALAALALTTRPAGEGRQYPIYGSDAPTTVVLHAERFVEDPTRGFSYVDRP